MLEINHKGKAATRTGPLGTAWMDIPLHYYPGEPSRVLSFTTRNHARAVCDAWNAKYQARQDTNNWHFYPVRIRERVEVVK